MTPLADAVGLVDDEEGRLAGSHTGIRLLVRELLGSQEEELGRALLELVERFLRSAAGKAELTWPLPRRPSRRSPPPGPVKGDQRGHHDGDAGHDRAGDL